MAVLIEVRGRDERERVVAAVLPSGKILSVEGYDTRTLENYVNHFGPNGPMSTRTADWDENDFFGAVVKIHKTPLNGDFKHITDPQEARQIIQEAGLKETGQKEVGSSADIAKMLGEEGLK